MYEFRQTTFDNKSVYFLSSSVHEALNEINTIYGFSNGNLYVKINDIWVKVSMLNFIVKSYNGLREFTDDEKTLDLYLFDTCYALSGADARYTIILIDAVKNLYPELFYKI